MADPGVMPGTGSVRAGEEKTPPILPFATPYGKQSATPRLPARSPRPRPTLLPPNPACRRRFRYAQVVATARKIAERVYRLLKYGQEYLRPSEEAYESAYRLRLEKALAKKAASLGYKLVPATQPV